MDLTQGMCDVADAPALSAEDIVSMREEQAAMEANMRSVHGHYARSGEPFTFPLLIESRYETNGGYMMDVVVTYDEKNTQHRVILGRDYYDAVGVSPDEFTVEMFRWLVAHKAPLHTEGTLEIDDFPVNYFSSSQLIQRWPDFADVFDAKPLKAAEGAAVGETALNAGGDASTTASSKRQLPGFESFFHMRTQEEYGNLSDPEYNREFALGPYASYGKVGERGWEGDGKDELFNAVDEEQEYYDPFTPFDSSTNDRSANAKLLFPRGKQGSAAACPEEELAA